MCELYVLLIAINGIIIIEFQLTLLFYRNPNLKLYNDYVDKIVKWFIFHNNHIVWYMNT